MRGPLPVFGSPLHRACVLFESHNDSDERDTKYQSYMLLMHVVHHYMYGATHTHSHSPDTAQPPRKRTARKYQLETVVMPTLLLHCATDGATRPIERVGGH